MLPDTVSRVAEHTAPYVNERIRRTSEENLASLAGADDATIERRLAELDREWDIERVLEANAATVMLTSVILAGAVDRRWLLLGAAVGGFLLQHALQGWCPPLIWFRRMGIRTANEIEEERYALKVLRGDFDELGSAGNGGSRISRVIEAVQR